MNVRHVFDIFILYVLIRDFRTKKIVSGLKILTLTLQNTYINVFRAFWFFQFTSHFLLFLEGRRVEGR